MSGRYLRRDPQAVSADDVRYLRALSLMKLGRFEEARTLLKQLEAEASSPELRAQAAYSLGDSFYFGPAPDGRRDRQRADRYYKEAVLKYPDHGEAEQVKRLLGLSHPPSPAPVLGQFGIEETGTALSYSVQVGAFSRKRNAERLLNRLLRNRYDAYIQSEPTRRFRVRVGRLEDREQAETLRAQLQKDGYPTKIIP